MSSEWEKKYAGYNQRMIEELAALRHSQMRAWSTSLIQALTKANEDKQSIKDFMADMLKLSSHNYMDYDRLPEDLKIQSRVFAYAVLDIVNKYSNK